MNVIPSKLGADSKKIAILARTRRHRFDAARVLLDFLVDPGHFLVVSRNFHVLRFDGRLQRADLAI